jgi:hypothetical protein
MRLNPGAPGPCTSMHVRAQKHTVPSSGYTATSQPTPTTSSWHSELCSSSDTHPCEKHVGIPATFSFGYMRCVGACGHVPNVWGHSQEQHAARVPEPKAQAPAGGEAVDPTCAVDLHEYDMRTCSSVQYIDTPATLDMDTCAAACAALTGAARGVHSKNTEPKFGPARGAHLILLEASLKTRRCVGNP